ncbi:MAG: hypothetical protein ACOYMD_16240 [Paludibacter sp.]
MIRFLSRKSYSFFIQIALYLFVNGLFILKYFPRAGIISPIILFLYCFFIISGIFLFTLYSNKISERNYKIGYFLSLIIICLAIIGLLVAIDRYSVRVDRWSAVTFFLDNLFQGKYPYSAHTHVSTTNFASPFPIWHIINIPFYLLGDVGIGLIFFLLVTAFLIQQLFLSYRKSFIFIALLALSPAYWWEVTVRSDSLSNALLVFAFIIWFSKQNYSLSTNFWLSILICGLISSTRLSAILPMALFLFEPFIKLDWKRRIIFPVGILGILLISFLPFIFWDTTNWIFFKRNPFMSQSSVGNPYLLLVMIVLGVFMAFRWKNISQFFSTTSIFLFIFVLTAQVNLIFSRGIQNSIFEDSLYDISYFTLLLPYCLAYICDFQLKNTHTSHVKTKI